MCPLFPGLPVPAVPAHNLRPVRVPVLSHCRPPAGRAGIALAVSVVLWACESAPSDPRDGRPKAELKQASELPEAHRALLEAYGRGGEPWAKARAAALEDPELERFLVDNLVIEMVRAWSAMPGDATERSREAFERAQGELARLGPSSVPVLAGLLEAPDGVVAELAARTLERIGRDAVGDVAKVLASPRRDARRRAAQLLERLPHAAGGEAEVTEALVRVLEDDPEWIVRAQTALAVGARGARDRDSAPAREALERALLDSDPVVAASAADGLARLADPLALSAMIAALERAQAQGDLRLVRALDHALQASSGETRSRDLAGWRSWWFEHRTEILRSRRGP